MKVTETIVNKANKLKILTYTSIQWGHILLDRRNTTFGCEKAESVFPETKNKITIAILITLFNIALNTPLKTVKQEKEIKAIQIGHVKVKLSRSYDMIFTKHKALHHKKKL